jgi:hypothetical protein
VEGRKAWKAREEKELLLFSRLSQRGEEKGKPHVTQLIIIDHTVLLVIL